MRDPQGLLLLIALALSVVVLFAVTRFFAIAATLVEIRDELRLARRERGSTLREAPEARKALAIAAFLLLMTAGVAHAQSSNPYIVDPSNPYYAGPGPAVEVGRTLGPEDAVEPRRSGRAVRRLSPRRIS